MKLKNIVMAGLALVASLAFTACETEWPDTNPLNKQGVNVVAYGPNPVARGGQLRFVGTGLDQIKVVVMPGAGEVTEIEHVSASDIRITVPQNADFGYISLKDASGKEYKMEKRLTFTEPVAFAAENAFAPTPVKAGQDLTISGDYLNLVQKVVLADGVEIDKFAEQSREKIVLKVPAEAQTGKVSLIFYATEDTIPNEIISKEKLDVVLPSVDSIVTLDEKKPGDEIIINGKDFDLITKLYATSGEEIDPFVVTETSIKFTLPDVVVNGVINVAPASGVKVPVATIGVALPKVTAVTDNTDVREGSVVTITGTDFEIASNVTFTAANDKTVDAEIEAGRTATELKVKVPAAAISGAFKINTTAGVTVEDEKLVITTLKPALTSYSANPIAANSDLTINGTALDLVASVQFSGIDPIAVEATATAITVFVPTTAQSGVVTLIMKNGETAAIEDLTISKPECAYVVDESALVTTDESPKRAGEILVFEVENVAHLTSIKVDGKDCQFIVNGNTVYCLTPESAGESQMELISDNGTILYNINLIPNTEICTVIWQGMETMDWGNNQQYLGQDGGAELIAVNGQVGDKLRLYITPTDAETWRLQIFNGHWDGQIFDISGDGNEGSQIEALEKGYFEFEITEEMYTKITTTGGWGGWFVIQGQNCIVTKLVHVKEVSLETEIWSGSETMDWGNNQQYLGQDGGADFLAAGGKVGSKIYIYITPSDAATWRLQIFNGHWDGQIFDISGDGNEGSVMTDLGPKSRFEITVTQEMYDKITTAGGWGGWFVIQGQNCVVTKMTLLK